MKADLITDFTAASDTLRIYQGDSLIFSSEKDRLEPLLDYLETRPEARQVTVLDTIAGNGAALLSILAHATEVWSPVGSAHAARTFREHGVDYHFESTVPAVQRADGGGICPMEKLSLGQTPAQFYTALRELRRA